MPIYDADLFASPAPLARVALRDPESSAVLPDVPMLLDSDVQLNGRLSRMTTNALDQHIEITPGVAGGKPRIAGRRISVQDVVVWHEQMGMSVDEICTAYDLAIADVYAALTYYFDHRPEVDRHIAEGDAFIEELRKRTPSVLQEKLDAHRGE